ncbi:MAG: hypothetical protein ACK4YQ_04230 [Phenylobacterium sp.]|uniref:hypothetical protein n=1 Tax=Phenylobacterium sp. TaxID=1871053 RepID=UPI00391B1FD7
MWTMPLRALQVVAALILGCAVLGFYLGFTGAPGRARLPGEAADGSSAAPLTATDARPIFETLEPPPPEPEKAEEEKPAEVAEAPPEKLEVEVPPLAVPPPKAPEPAQPPEDKVGDLLDGVTPPPVDAPIY